MTGAQLLCQTSQTHSDFQDTCRGMLHRCFPSSSVLAVAVIAWAKRRSLALSTSVPVGSVVTMVRAAGFVMICQDDSGHDPVNFG